MADNGIGDESLREIDMLKEMYYMRPENQLADCVLLEA